ncbi:conserved hypothetical protein [Ahrensia sp. R2A130]|nr:conserved hypothetical protein [Ahrensia sp. R2A130]
MPDDAVSPNTKHPPKPNPRQDGRIEDLTPLTSRENQRKVGELG